jgi:hypothetical protein
VPVGEFVGLGGDVGGGLGEGGADGEEVDGEEVDEVQRMRAALLGWLEGFD